MPEVKNEKPVATQMVAPNTSTASANLREYIAKHEITGSHQGKRKTWKRGDTLMLDEVSAKLLGDAVERA